MAPQSSSVISARKKPSRGWKCLAFCQIHLDPSTNEIKLPLYGSLGLRGAKHNTLDCLSCLVTHYNRLVCPVAKVNSDNQKGGSDYKLRRPASLSHANKVSIMTWIASEGLLDSVHLWLCVQKRWLDQIGCRKPNIWLTLVKWLNTSAHTNRNTAANLKST